MRKHLLSIALSNRILQKIDQEATKQKKSRSEQVELHFETLFLNLPETEKELTIKIRRTFLKPTNPKALKRMFSGS
jgi:hypothetical protein